MQMPADFAERYAVSTRAQITAHYGFSNSQCDRFGKLMTGDVRASHATVCHVARCVTHKVRLAVKPRAMRRPIPDDFADNFRRMTKAALVRHYAAGMATVIKWSKTMTDADAVTHKAHVAAVLVQSQVAAVASAAANRAANPKPAKVNPPKPVKVKRTPGRGVTWGNAKAVPIPEAKADIVSMAMRHLMRDYVPVHRSETVAGKAAIGLFKVGRMTMTEPELLALAARRGFTVSEGFQG